MNHDHGPETALHHGEPFRETLGGDGRIRTGDGGFADLCLATWPRRRGLVPRRGFEPPRRKARPPQGRVSTKSTTSAWSAPSSHANIANPREGQVKPTKGAPSPASSRG